MGICATCGNDYDRSFTVTLDGQSHTFDSFECAIHALAPACPHCGVRIVGHGVQHEGTVLCCKHCADMMGARGITDRVGDTPAQPSTQSGTAAAPAGGSHGSAAGGQAATRSGNAQTQPGGGRRAGAGDDVDEVASTPGPKGKALGNAGIEAPAAPSTGRGITDRL